MFNYELLIPIVLFISMAVVLGLFLMYRHRTRAELQQTVRMALDKGQELTPDIIDRLGQPKQAPSSDLRRAVIWLAIGIGFALFGLILDEDEAVRPLIAIGAFPMAIGIAYLIMSRVSEKDAST
jgi:predicted MFS family arabinose efflux permease